MIIVSSNSYLYYSGAANLEAVPLSILELLNTKIWRIFFKTLKIQFIDVHSLGAESI